MLYLVHSSLQVAFGSMQHEVVVYSYLGPANSLKGEEGNLPFKDGMPFSRQALSPTTQPHKAEC